MIGVMKTPRALLFDAVIALQAKLLGLRKKSVPIDAMNMVYYERGKPSARPSFILIHGYTANKDVWARFAHALPNGAHAVIPDLAGHGESGFDARWDYSPKAQADRIAQLMEKLGIPNAVILGNSMGGNITANFAIFHPTRAKAICVFNPGGVRTITPSVADELFAQGDNPFAISSLADFKRLYGMTMYKAPPTPEIIIEEVSHRYQLRKPNYIQILRDIADKNRLEGRLGDIKVPTLIVWGKEDKIIHHSGAKQWSQGVACSEVQLLEGIGHMPMVEAPKLSANLVMKFLTAKGLWN